MGKTVTGEVRNFSERPVGGWRSVGAICSSGVTGDERTLSPEMAWPELRTHVDCAPGEVAAALERRVEILHERGRFDELWRDVNDPMFMADARVHAVAATSALRVVGALAWYTPDAARVHATLRLTSEITMTRVCGRRRVIGLLPRRSNKHFPFRDSHATSAAPVEVVRSDAPRMAPP